MQTVRITTSQNIDIDYEVAGVGERFLARLIDYGLFIAIYLLAVVVILIIGKGFGGGALTVILIIYAALFVFYDLICEVTMAGQNFGKMIMKIKVISIDGGRPSFGQYLMRWLFRIVDFTLSSYLCGLLCVAMSEKHQRLGDMVAGTTLIKTKRRVQKQNLIFTQFAEQYQPTFKDLYKLTDRDIALIQEVVRNYTITGNAEVVINASARVKEILEISSLPEGMNELRFLQIVIRDYTHTAVINDLQLNS